MSYTKDQQETLDIIMSENDLCFSDKKFSDLTYEEGSSNEKKKYYVVKKDVSEFINWHYYKHLVIEKVKNENGTIRNKLYISGVTPWRGEETLKDLQENYILLQNELVLPKGYIVHDRNKLKGVKIENVSVDTQFKDMYAFKLVKKKTEENKNLEYKNSDKYVVTPYKLTIIDKKDEKGKKVLCVTNVYGCIDKFNNFEDLFKKYVSGYKPKKDKKGGTRRRRRGSKGGSRKNRRSRKSM